MHDRRKLQHNAVMVYLLPLTSLSERESSFQETCSSRTRQRQAKARGNMGDHIVKSRQHVHCMLMTMQKRDSRIAKRGNVRRMTPGHTHDSLQRKGLEIFMSSAGPTERQRTRGSSSE
jgi:hypothetical protein